jgi:hypothetical protein
VRRGLLVAALAAGLLAASAGPASASFHEIKIQEVFPGSGTNSGEDYVTLQMYSEGQNFVGGHTLTVFNANGTVAGNGATFPEISGPDVPNGDNQSTILIGAEATVVAVAPDLIDADLAAIDPAAGAVCWEDLDCVAWGAFTPPLGGLPSPAVSSGSPITDGQVLVRKINTAGCESMLEAADDSDVVNDDFSGAGPVPRNNSTSITEVACFDTEITKGPTGKTTDRTPKFRFKSIPAGAPTISCALDDPENTFGCTSPLTLPKQSFGRHKLYVAATNSVFVDDPTPAVRKFKVVRGN